LLEILAAARAHAAPLAAESAGYLMLGVADHLALAPRGVIADEIELSPDGSVRLRAPRAGVNGASPEVAVRRLLGRALEVASAAGPALRRAAERRDEAGLPGLVRELETALIPVNRSAAKRALTRLHRETERARDAGKLEAQLQNEAAVQATPAPLAEAMAFSAQLPETAPPAPVLPSVVPAVAVVAAVPVTAPLAVQAPATAPLAVQVPAAAPVAPPPAAFLSPPPLPTAVNETLTKPEPVVARARERGSSTPRLGTVVTAQSLPGEEGELTERAPSVALEADELAIDVVVEVEPVIEPSELALAPQPLVDPEPSRIPDVLSAMLALHVGIEADEAPTRLRGVVTEPLAESLPQPQSQPVPVQELCEPAVHEALTWNPGAVEERVPEAALRLHVIEPELPLEPYAPAVLPARISDVSELLDSFHVSGASEERELRGALKEMAGLELTPLAYPLVHLKER
jgi:hypothetical protein